MSKVVLLTGPAGVGKSTTADRFIDAEDGVWAYIGQDDIRHFIRSGFADPTKAWNSQTESQWKISVDICCYIIKKYYANDINCIVDAFISTKRLPEWEELLSVIDYKIVVLLPDIETNLKRNSQRAGSAAIPEVNIRGHHDLHSSWKEDNHIKVIDNSNLSVEEVVKAIRQWI